MIDYSPFWKTIKCKGENTFTLNRRHSISNGTIDRLRHNKPLSTTTLDRLCDILECELSDIAVYKNTNK